MDPLRKGFRFDTVIADFVEACVGTEKRVIAYALTRRLD